MDNGLVPYVIRVRANDVVLLIMSLDQLKVTIVTIFLLPFLLCSVFLKMKLVLHHLY